MKQKKIILPIAALAITAALFTGAFMGGGTGGKSTSYKTFTLETTDLQDTISATGAVESIDVTKVYSGTLSSKVITQNVEVGDHVTEGDILCALDTSTLERQIRQQQANMTYSGKTSQQSIHSAQNSYDNLESGLDEGLNSSLLTQQAQVNNAKNAVDTAKLSIQALEIKSNDDTQATTDAQKKDWQDYTDTRKDWQEAAEALVKADAKLAAAESAYRTMQQNPASEQDLTLLKSAYDAAKTAQAAAKNHMESVESNYDVVRVMYPGIASQYDKADATLANAQVAYNTALQALDAANFTIQQQLNTSADSLKNAEANAVNEGSLATLQGYQEQLEDAIIKAPASGTVTAVYAKDGAPASGLLYVIEDTDHLQISTTVKEYDITTVQTGMKAEISTDATGEETFEGTLSKISPTSQKSADGSTVTATTVEFPATVTVDSADTPLRIGMNTRLNIVVQEKAGVFAVPYDAIVELDGKQVVYTADISDKGVTTARAIEVTTGMETDFYTEISGSGLTEGMKLISNPDGLQNGQEIKGGTDAA